MPRADWGIDPEIIDEFDRDAQFKPYAGPTPPDGVFLFRVKVCKYTAATKQKLAQLRVGIELVPREKEEKRYKDYFILAFLPIANNTAFRYVPFLDAIGVTSTEFTRKTIYDENGDVKKIGSWKNEGDTLLLAQLKTGEDQNGLARKEVAWFGAYDPDATEEEEDDDDYDYDEEEED